MSCRLINQDADTSTARDLIAAATPRRADLRRAVRRQQRVRELRGESRTTVRAVQLTMPEP